MTVFNKLQKQRDLEMIISESVSDLISEWDSLLNDKNNLIKTFTVINVNFTAFNIRYQLYKEKHWAEWESLHNISVFKHSQFSNNKHSQKLLNSLYLNNKTDSIWDSWIDKMCVKLSVNADHYFNNIFWMRYILFWLKE